MAGHAQAPLLVHEGTKQRSSGYWSYDPDVLEFIGNETGRAYSQFRLMLYLMGNNGQPGEKQWRCAEADVLKRTGISDAGSLSRVKKALKARGWIDYKEGAYIKVLFDNIYAQMRQGCSENKSDNEKSQGCSENKAEGCSQNKSEGCSENNHNNKSNNIKENNKSDFVF